MVILDVSPLLWIYRFVDARVSDIDPYPLPEGTGYGVRGMDPAVCVEHILRDVLGVNTVDGVADILSGGDNQRESQQEADGHGVVQPKNGTVDCHLADFDEALEASEHVQHFSGLLGRAV